MTMRLFAQFKGLEASIGTESAMPIVCAGSENDGDFRRLP